MAGALSAMVFAGIIRVGHQPQLHVVHQLDLPPLRSALVHHPRRQHQRGRARALHHGRVVAQQPPRLPAARPARCRPRPARHLGRGHPPLRAARAGRPTCSGPTPRCSRSGGSPRNAMTTDDERIALFLDYENLAIGARDDLGGMPVRLPPDRRRARRARAGRRAPRLRRLVVLRRGPPHAHPPPGRADRDPAAHGRGRARTPPTSRWRSTRSSSRSSATTSPRSCSAPATATSRRSSHKLRELNRRVIGVGIEASTSAPAAARVRRVPLLRAPRGRRRPAQPSAAAAAAQPRPGRRSAAPAEPQDCRDAAEAEESRAAAQRRRRHRPRRARHPDARRPASAPATAPVLASTLKRTILRKDPTFNEADYGFRGVRRAAAPPRRARGVIELSRGRRQGRPRGAASPSTRDDEDAAFALPASTVEPADRASRAPPHLSGLKTQLRKTPARLQREALRLRRLPAVRQGGAHPRPDRHGAGTTTADDYVLRTVESGDQPT